MPPRIDIEPYKSEILDLIANKSTYEAVFIPLFKLLVFPRMANLISPDAVASLNNALDQV
jgi:hypothetical protein